MAGLATAINANGYAMRMWSWLDRRLSENYVYDPLGIFLPLSEDESGYRGETMGDHLHTLSTQDHTHPHFRAAAQALLKHKSLDGVFNHKDLHAKHSRSALSDSGNDAGDDLRSVLSYGMDSHGEPRWHPGATYKKGERKGERMAHPLKTLAQQAIAHHGGTAHDVHDRTVANFAHKAIDDHLTGSTKREGKQVRGTNVGTGDTGGDDDAKTTEPRGDKARGSTGVASDEHHPIIQSAWNDPERRKHLQRLGFFTHKDDSDDDSGEKKKEPSLASSAPHKTLHRAIKRALHVAHGGGRKNKGQAWENRRGDEHRDSVLKHLGLSSDDWDRIQAGQGPAGQMPHARPARGAPARKREGELGRLSRRETGEREREALKQAPEEIAGRSKRRSPGREAAASETVRTVQTVQTPGSATDRDPKTGEVKPKPKEDVPELSKKGVAARAGTSAPRAGEVIGTRKAPGLLGQSVRRQMGQEDTPEARAKRKKEVEWRKGEEGERKELERTQLAISGTKARKELAQTKQAELEKSREAAKKAKADQEKRKAAGVEDGRMPHGAGTKPAFEVGKAEPTGKRSRVTPPEPGPVRHMMNVDKDKTREQQYKPTRSPYEGSGQGRKFGRIGSRFKTKSRKQRALDPDEIFHSDRPEDEKQRLLSGPKYLQMKQRLERRRRRAQQRQMRGQAPHGGQSAEEQAIYAFGAGRISIEECAAVLFRVNPDHLNEEVAGTMFDRWMNENTPSLFERVCA